MATLDTCHPRARSTTGPRQGLHRELVSSRQGLPSAIERSHMMVGCHDVSRASGPDESEVTKDAAASAPTVRGPLPIASQITARRGQHDRDEAAPRGRPALPSPARREWLGDPTPRSARQRKASGPRDCAGAARREGPRRSPRRVQPRSAARRPAATANHPGSARGPREPRSHRQPRSEQRRESTAGPVTWSRRRGRGFQ